MARLLVRLRRLLRARPLLRPPRAALRAVPALQDGCAALPGSSANVRRTQSLREARAPAGGPSGQDQSEMKRRQRQQM